MSYLQTEDGSEESQGGDDGREDVSFFLVLGNSHQYSQEDGKTAEVRGLRSSTEFYVVAAPRRHASRQQGLTTLGKFYVQLLRKLLFLVRGWGEVPASIRARNAIFFMDQRRLSFIIPYH